MLFHEYIIKIPNNNHWYKVKLIDYVNLKVVIIYKTLYREISFFDIVDIKVLDRIKKVNNVYD